MDVMTLQEDFFTLIDKAIKDDKLSHAYLIETNDLLDVDSFLFILIKNCYVLQIIISTLVQNVMSVHLLIVKTMQI